MKLRHSSCRKKRNEERQSLICGRAKTEEKKGKKDGVNRGKTEFIFQTDYTARTVK